MILLYNELKLAFVHRCIYNILEEIYFLTRIAPKAIQWRLNVTRNIAIYQKVRAGNFEIEKKSKRLILLNRFGFICASFSHKFDA